MKIYRIYRIAVPLPLDEIAVEEGATSVDSLLNGYIIQVLDEKYNFQLYLGSGMFGVAYLAAGNRVVKITTDAQEFEMAKSVVDSSWMKHAPFAEIYEATDLSMEEEIYAEGLYVIVKEKVKALDEDEQSLFMYFIDEYEGLAEDNEERIMESEPQNMPLFQKFEEYMYDVQNYQFADTFNPGNVGWDTDGNLVCYDARHRENVF